ncbi:hypothetical protein SSX86_029898 [Deinandra increscens subsp. villosa]|uniref:Uncharacterized protein n=1 Tax=Deinandra increscens subsp. villosa TaxID=3103831 RepID=A0AAP0GMV5_9ASTR
MEQKLSVENWVQIHSHDNQESKPQNNDDGDEALSLCDLAPSEHDDPVENQPQQRLSDDQQEDFAFGFGSLDSPENNMSSADELFFRGEILPLRHSVTLPSRSMTRNREFTRSISLEPVSVACSRSSSQNSRTSLSSSSTSASELNGYKPALRNRNRNRNQFHSHPSPTPQIRTRSFNSSNPKSVKPLSNWGFLQLGPMKLKKETIYHFIRIP